MISYNLEQHYLPLIIVYFIDSLFSFQERFLKRSKKK